MQEPALCCTTSVAVGTRAFNNYNGIGISLCYSPQPPSAVQQATASWSSIAQGRDPAQVQPPPMLAVVLDASMAQPCLESAVQSLTQALLQLKPQTRLLLIVVDQVVTMLDLKSPKPQSWVLHGAAGPGAAVLPRIVRAADVRATPLAHCEQFIAQSLAAIRHYPRQQTLQHHLQIVTAAVDIALFLLTASMAAWDTQNRRQAQNAGGSAAQPAQARQQQRGTAPGTADQPMDTPPMHNARVMVLTALPSSSTASPAAAMQLMQQLEPAGQQQLQQMVGALAGKAASLDIPIDVISGSLAAPAALLLQEVVTASHGRLLHQPQLAPPLASNIVALAQSRFGWEGIIDIRVPPGVRVGQLSGPVAPSSALPAPAYLSGTTELPVLMVGSPKAATAAAAVKEVAMEGSIPTGAAAAADQSSGSATAAQPQQLAAAGDQPAAAAAPGAGSGPISWSPAATAVPVVSIGTRFVAVLELSRDWSPGSSFEVQVVCEWTAADGRRTRQVCTHRVSVSDRVFSFLDGLDVPAVVLLMAQRLVTGAAAVAAPAMSAGIKLQQLSAVPKSKALEEGRLSVGMALAHIAQRLGHAHTARKGILGFGSQLVYELPEEMIPLALSLYQLQRGNLLNPDLVVTEPWEQQLLTSAHPAGTSAAPSTSERHRLRTGNDDVNSSLAMYGSWRMIRQQFMQAAPSSALRMVAPWLYVYDSNSGQFEVLPPLNLALEPDALAVLDCGSEVIIYVGSILEAMVEGRVADSRSSKQQEQQAGERAVEGMAVADAAPASNAPVTNGVQAPGRLTAAAGEGSSSPAKAPGGGLAAAPDMAMAAAPAVRCAQQLVHGRVPVPPIKLVEDPADMVQLMKRLVPLHSDPVALQLLLLPHLRDLTPAQHGYLLDWHNHWATAAQEGLSVPAAGGARLAHREVSGELSFGQWYSSFGVVLRSPGGTMGSDGVTLD